MPSIQIVVLTFALCGDGWNTRSGGDSGASDGIEGSDYLSIGAFVMTSTASLSVLRREQTRTLLGLGILSSPLWFFLRGGTRGLGALTRSGGRRGGCVSGCGWKQGRRYEGWCG